MKYILITSLIAIIVAPSCLAAGSSTLTLSAASNKFEVNKTFNVSIIADPSGSTIDTVRIKVGYSPELLELIDFKFGPSFSFPSGGNGYDNNLGILSQGAGVPGGATAKSVFGTITFKAKVIGSAKIFIDSSSLMLASGINNFDGVSKGATLSIIAPIPVPVNKNPEPVKSDPAPVKTQPIKKDPAKQTVPVNQPATFDEAIDLEDSSKGVSPVIFWIIGIILSSVCFGFLGYLIGANKISIISTKKDEMFNKQALIKIAKAAKQFLINITNSQL